MSKKSTYGSSTRKTKINRAQLRDLFSEQMLRMIESRGFINEMFKLLDDIKDPERKLRCALELLKFSIPQLASSRIEMVNDEAPTVTKIVFAPSAVPALAAVSPKPLD